MARRIHDETERTVAHFHDGNPDVRQGAPALDRQRLTGSLADLLIAWRDAFTNTDILQLGIASIGGVPYMGQLTSTLANYPSAIRPAIENLLIVYSQLYEQELADNGAIVLHGDLHLGNTVLDGRAVTGLWDLSCVATGPYDQARTRLVFGEWLRRHRRPTAAKEQLLEADETFDRIGAHGWLPRVRAELTALGETAPGEVDAGSAGGLTPQELQVVRRVAMGMSNREIAAELFLSPRTVGHHLYKAYPKLGSDDGPSWDSSTYEGLRASGARRLSTSRSTDADVPDRLLASQAWESHHPQSSHRQRRLRGANTRRVAGTRHRQRRRRTRAAGPGRRATPRPQDV